jgi:hypothetical protein
MVIYIFCFVTFQEFIFTAFFILVCDTFLGNCCEGSIYRLFFFLLHMVVQLFQHHLSKRPPSFLHCVVFTYFFVTDQCTVFMWILFKALYSVPLSCMSIFSPIPFYLEYCTFSMCWSQVMSVLWIRFFVPLQYWVGYSRAFG